MKDQQEVDNKENVINQYNNEIEELSAVRISTNYISS